MMQARLFSRPEMALMALAAPLAMSAAQAAPGGVPGPPAPSASIRTLERSVASDWTGNGDIAIGTRLCITSSSGTYRLTLTMPGLFRNLPADAQVSLRLTDATGDVQVRPLGGGSTVEFVGHTIGRGQSDCENGKYALLQALIPQNVLTSQQAGDYMSQIAMSVAPA